MIEEIGHGLYLITCDKCGYRQCIEDCRSTSDAAWQMEEMGWGYERDGNVMMDVCPSCKDNEDQVFCKRSAKT